MGESIIERLKSQLQRYESLNTLYSEALRTNKPNSAKSYHIQLLSIEKSIRFTVGKLKNLAFSRITEIKFTVDDRLHTARLTNLNNEEIEFILKGIYHTHNLKILEIKEIPAYISDLKL